jgi:4-hydroxybenzoate polyprenyltransferase
MHPHTSAPSHPAASPSPRATIFAWLELARLSNLPTVLGNVLVAVAAAATSPDLRGEGFHWGAVLPLFVAVALLYTSGMMLNDVADAHVDARERPSRPVPSGRIRSNHALLAAAGCMLAGTLLLILAGAPPRLALLLPAAIVAYDLTHDRFAASALFMGACRGLVYLICAAAVAGRIPEAAWLLGGLVAAYTTVVTLIAQKETGAPGTWRRVLSLAPPLIVLPALIASGGGSWHAMDVAVAMTGLAAVAWLARAPVLILNDPPRVKPAVLTMLSGMCLVDLFFLAVLGAPVAALVIGGACFVLTVLLHRRIAGT